jgi:hypothetical protein
MTVLRAVNLIKSNSSRWTKRRGRTFSWQEGYSSFSVSASNIPVVKRYVLNQVAHHRKRSYDDQLFSLLREHGIESDPEHVLSAAPNGAHHLFIHAPRPHGLEVMVLPPGGSATNVAFKTWSQQTDKPHSCFSAEDLPARSRSSILDRSSSHSLINRSGATGRYEVDE